MPKTTISSLSIARQLVMQVLEPGGTAIDATAGKGRDTLFLAQTVGPHGKVWSFDVQAEAVQTTQTLLVQKGLAERVNVLQAGHEDISAYITKPVNAVMFNLGYMPGGDKTLITRVDTTLSALTQALALLAPSGIITIVLYTGHPGGDTEAARLEELVAGLSPAEFNVIKVVYPNQIKEAPYVIAVQKR